MTNFEKQKEKITPKMDTNETDCRPCPADCPAVDLCNRYPEAHHLPNFCKWMGSLRKFNPHDDKLFLLSKEEYDSVRKNIKRYCIFSGYGRWWLCSYSPYGGSLVYDVSSNCDVDFANEFYFNDRGVAPAFIEKTNEKIGTIQVKYKFPFVYVGNDIWIAENFIFHSRFDKESSDYKRSEIRQKILKWAKERE